MPPQPRNGAEPAPGPDRRHHHLAVPAARGADRLAAVLDRGGVRRHALVLEGSGLAASQQMLQYELGHLSNHFTRSVVVQEPGRTAHQLVDTGYEWVFVRSGLLERMSQTAERARAPSQGKSQDGVRNFRYYISQVYVWAENYLIAAAFTTLTFLVRLLVLVLTLPLILTAAFVGLIDGLVRQDVRRFGAGRESGLHLPPCESELMPLAVLPWVTTWRCRFRCIRW